MEIPHRSPRELLGVTRVAGFLFLLGCITMGCNGTGSTSPPPDQASRRGSPAAKQQASTGNVVNGVPLPTLGTIAEGKAMSAGGAPPEYTFKTLWKKALRAAQKWHGDAYLVRAVGQYINNQGVPSYWFLTFLSPADHLYRLDMEIDPWGNVSKENIWKGGSQAELRQFRVVYGDTPVPANIVDSDWVVEQAVPAASAQFPLNKTKDPAAVINWDKETNKSVWSYIFLYRSTAQYCGVDLDAQTGKVIKVWRGSSKGP